MKDKTETHETDKQVGQAGEEKLKIQHCRIIISWEKKGFVKVASATEQGLT